MCFQTLASFFKNVNRTWSFLCRLTSTPSLSFGNYYEGVFKIFMENVDCIKKKPTHGFKNVFYYQNNLIFSSSSSWTCQSILIFWATLTEEASPIQNYFLYLLERFLKKTEISCIAGIKPHYKRPSVILNCVQTSCKALSKKNMNLRISLIKSCDIYVVIKCAFD